MSTVKRGLEHTCQLRHEFEFGGTDRQDIPNKAVSARALFGAGQFTSRSNKGCQFIEASLGDECRMGKLLLGTVIGMTSRRP
jgi:hypothetical protein